MAVNLRGFDTQRQYNHIFPSTSPSSYLNYTYTSEQTNTREAILLELEKQRIREKILAEELQIVEDELRRELIREHGMTAAPRSGGFPSSLELEIVEDELRRELIREHGMTVAPRSGGFPSRTHHYQFEPEMHRHRELLPPENRRILMPFHERYDDSGPLPFHRRPTSEIFSLGKRSGSKREAPTPPIREDFSYAVRQISATSARDLNEHVSRRE